MLRIQCRVVAALGVGLSVWIGDAVPARAEPSVDGSFWSVPHNFTAMVRDRARGRHLPTFMRRGEKAIVVVLGGDLGLGGSDQRVSPAGAYRHGKRYDWGKLTRHLRPLINGDLNFANLETVVTSSNRLPPADKKFRFRSHPAGIRHLVGMGFNAFSLANNHAIDYGRAGMRDTRRHIARLRVREGLAAAGLGTDATAFRPAITETGNGRIALSAIGIGGVAPGAKRIGMARYRQAGHFDRVLDELARMPSDFKILSVHYGIERRVHPARKHIQRFRDLAVRAKGIDLVVGHHAHVPAGVQMVDGKVIFYGMGNLLHPGMQNMGRFDRCGDYGLLARLYLLRSPTGHLHTAAIEVHALRDMHLASRPQPAAAGRQRIAVLNHLAAGLDDMATGARGVRFQPQDDGRGLYCTPAARSAAGRIGALCRDWQLPLPQSRDEQHAIAQQCEGPDRLVARRHTTPDSRARMARPAAGRRRVASAKSRTRSRPRRKHRTRITRRRTMRKRIASQHEAGRRWRRNRRTARGHRSRRMRRLADAYPDNFN